MFYLFGPSFVLLLLCKKVFVEFGFVSPLGPFLFYFRVQNIVFLTHAFERGQIKTVYFKVFLKYIATAALRPTVSILIASNMCIVSASETCLFLSLSDVSPARHAGFRATFSGINIIHILLNM